MASPANLGYVSKTWDAGKGLSNVVLSWQADNTREIGGEFVDLALTPEFDQTFLTVPIVPKRSVSPKPSRLRYHATFSLPADSWFYWRIVESRVDDQEITSPVKRLFSGIAPAVANEALDYVLPKNLKVGNVSYDNHHDTYKVTFSWSGGVTRNNCKVLEQYIEFGPSPNFEPGKSIRHQVNVNAMSVTFSDIDKAGLYYFRLVEVIQHQSGRVENVRTSPVAFKTAGYNSGSSHHHHGH